MNAVLKEHPVTAVKRLRKRASLIMPDPDSILSGKAIVILRESAKTHVPAPTSIKPERAKKKVPRKSTAAMPDLASICDTLRELHRQRQDFHRAEKSLTLQVKAICRRLCDGDKGEADVLYKAIAGKGEHPQSVMADVCSGPLLQARSILETNRLNVEKMMAREAKKLPVAGWVDGIKGFGIGSLAAFIGEAGDLNNYATHSKLWKRLGLAVIDGGRQRRVKGADALLHGYSASRRSVVWNIGQCVFKAQSMRIDKETGEVKTEAGKYRRIYDARKELELTRVETKGHAHNRATRYMEKKLMRDLWKAWRAM